MAPEPIMEPTAAIGLKSMRVSTREAGRYPDEGPDGANAFSWAPPSIPPLYWKITVRIGVPMGMRNTPGLFTSPLTPTNFKPDDPPTPWALNHSTPLARICG